MDKPKKTKNMAVRAFSHVSVRNIGHRILTNTTTNAIDLCDYFVPKGVKNMI